MIPPLRTERLTLDAFTAADAPQVELLAGDEAVALTTLNIPHPYPAGAAVSWIATHAGQCRREEGITWAIRLKDGTLIGCIGLRLARDHARAELGYWVAVPHWNRGYATEAARACIAHAFRDLDLHKIAAHHFATNPASGRVMQKLGMKREGILRRHVCRSRVFHDIVAYGLLREDAASGQTTPSA